MYITFQNLGKQGRLGNQLFQIAATIGYALENGCKYYFKNFKYEKYLNLNYTSPYEDFVNIEYKETDFSYNKIPKVSDLLKHTDNNTIISLSGYFQSEKYFKQNSFIVKKSFELRKNHKKYLYEKYNLEDNNYCGIHVRRTDYVNNPYYEQLNKEYYLNAVKTLYGNEWNNIHYIVCSDDIEYCKNMFSDFNNVAYSNENIDIYDLYLLSYCKDLIMANSSFSWWSAFLKEENYGRVITPTLWFTSKLLNTKDLYLEKWIKI